MSAAPAIEAESLTKIYPGGVQAVKGISFQVSSGEAFGLLGPNGAGKSTTIGMLNTTVIPTSGSAFLGGRNVAKDPIGTRAISSVVFQDAVVDRPFTGRQNLELHLQLWGADDEEGRSRLERLTSVAGLSEFIERPVSTYSGGQRRRLEIVRALLSGPEVVFLDEPTVGLDTRIRHDLFDVLHNLRDETGVTILLTTHYLDEAEQLCDRIAIVESGQIVACDTPDNLLADVGERVLEVRVSDTPSVVRVLLSAGIPESDILVIGSTVTASLRSVGGDDMVGRLREAGVAVRSATMRSPTLDDVYLRLTGDHMDVLDEEEIAS